MSTRGPPHRPVAAPPVAQPPRRRAPAEPQVLPAQTPGCSQEAGRADPILEKDSHKRSAHHDHLPHRRQFVPWLLPGQDDLPRDRDKMLVAAFHPGCYRDL